MDSDPGTVPDSDSDPDHDSEFDDEGSPDDDPGDDRERPEWWVRNEQIKREMGIPGYEPSKFEDGRYTHEVISDLEKRHDCTIRFVAVGVRYPEDWTVRIDGERAFPVGRHRDANGNTVFEVTAAEFRQRVSETLEERT